jgi:hypothetical protein
MKNFNRFMQSKWGIFALVILCAAIAHLQGHSAFAFMAAGLIAGVPGEVDYTNQTGDARIPALFSRIYRDKFYDAVCAANITNTKYTGELKGLGNQVTINTIPTVKIYPLVRGQKRQWQELTSAPVIMTVNRGTVFDCLILDADKSQMWDKDFLGTLSKDARQQNAIYVDGLFLSTNYPYAAAANTGTAAGKKSGTTATVAGPGYNMGVSGTPRGVNKVNVVDAIRDCQSVGDEQSWPTDDRWMVIPTWMENIMDMSDYKDESMTGMKSTWAGGRIGTCAKFKLYSTNLYTPIADGSGHTAYPVIFGHISAISFVQQLANVKYFPELQEVNGAGLCGENIFDWSVTYPDALGVLYCYQNR